jgi:hypothetical protein
LNKRRIAGRRKKTKQITKNHNGNEDPGQKTKHKDSECGNDLYTQRKQNTKNGRKQNTKNLKTKRQAARESWLGKKRTKPTRSWPPSVYAALK